MPWDGVAATPATAPTAHLAPTGLAAYPALDKRTALWSAEN